MQHRTDDCNSHPTNFITQCFPSKCWWIKLLRGLRASSCQPVAVKMYNMMHNCSQSNFLHRKGDFHRPLYWDKQSLSHFVHLVQCVSVLCNTKEMINGKIVPCCRLRVFISPSFLSGWRLQYLLWALVFYLEVFWGSLCALVFLRFSEVYFVHLFPLAGCRTLLYFRELFTIVCTCFCWSMRIASGL